MFVLYRNTICGIILLLLFFSCNGTNETRKFLVRAENFMQNQPDSALILLRDSVDIESLSYRDMALYALLLTQACDKNYIDHTSDSLINIAVKYYKYRGDDLRRAQAYFYLGSVYRDMEKTTDAIEAFLKAKEELPPMYNTRFRDMINRNLAGQYDKLDLYEKGMEMARENYQACLSRNDSIEILFPLSDIAYFYLYENEVDSALSYYSKALDISENINDSLERISILYGLSQTLYLKEDFVNANLCVEKAISISRRTRDSLFYFTMKGDILLSLNKIDSARYFLKEGVHSNDMNISSYCAESLYELEKSIGNTKDAITYSDLYLTLKDSLNAVNRREDALTLINNHSINVHTRQLLSEWKQERIVWIISVVISVLIMFFFIYYLMRSRRIYKDKTLVSNSYPDENIVDCLQHAKQQFMVTETYKYMTTINSNSINMEINLNSNERQKIGKEVAIYFSNAVIILKNKYDLTDDDLYFLFLFYLKFSHKTITIFMGVTSDALRSRKKRLRKKLDEEVRFIII